MDKPDGSKVQLAYDADGNRLSKTVISGGQNPTTTVVSDTYALGRLASQSDGNGTLLAAFTYDTSGVPTSVLVGSDPATATRYYYVYNGHGDVVALSDANGILAATYSYDEYGVLTGSSETFANGWSNPYRYDGRDGVRYDGRDRPLLDERAGARSDAGASAAVLRRSAVCDDGRCARRAVLLGTFVTASSHWYRQPVDECMSHCPSQTGR